VPAAVGVDVGLDLLLTPVYGVAGIAAATVTASAVAAG
jgi:hypothetical protein